MNERASSPGKRIAQARRRDGFDTQGQLAKALGVSIATISRWENDEDTPTGQNLPKLLSVLPSLALGDFTDTKVVEEPKNLYYDSGNDLGAAYEFKDVLVQPDFVQAIRRLKAIWRHRSIDPARWDAIAENLRYFSEPLDTPSSTVRTPAAGREPRPKPRRKADG